MPIINQPKSQSSIYIQLRLAERDKRGHMTPVKGASFSYTVPDVPFEEAKETVRRAFEAKIDMRRKAG